MYIHVTDRSPSLALPDYVGSETHVTKRGDVEFVQTMFANEAFFDAIDINNSPAFFLAGYGASRRTERPEGYSERSRLPRYQRVASLFEEHVGLVPFTYAFLQLKDLGYLEQAVELVNGLLPEDINLTTRIDGQRRPLFDWQGVSLPFSALSDGFRTYIGWLWDLLYQLASVIPSDSGLTASGTRSEIHGSAKHVTGPTFSSR
jgi:hypothetical protein